MPAHPGAKALAGATPDVDGQGDSWATRTTSTWRDGSG
jgi:hypothetical protein